MRKINDLSDSEVKSFSDELAEIQCDATEKVIKFADKFNVSRDDVMKTFLTTMLVATELKSFKDYEISEEEANENRG